MSESMTMEQPTNPTPTPLANDPAARTETGEIIDRSATPPANEPAPEPKSESAAPATYTDFAAYEHELLGISNGTYDNLVVQRWSADNEHSITYQPDMDLHITCDFNYSPNCCGLRVSCNAR